jgi:hypothetical protein
MIASDGFFHLSLFVFLGSEAMFADLCYFSVRSVQVKKQENTCLMYPI